MYECNWSLSVSGVVHEVHTTGKIQYHDFIKFMSNTIYLNKVERKKKVTKIFVTKQAGEIMYFIIIFCPSNFTGVYS